MSPKLNSIVILHSDVRREYFATEEGYQTEKNARKDARAIARYTQSLARRVHILPADSKWIQNVIKLRPSVVVNLVDSIQGDDTKTPLVCATLEMLGIPFTGNGFKPIVDCYDKYTIKDQLRRFEIPTPMGFIARNVKTISIPPHMKYPAIVKLNSIHGSVGLSDSNIVHSEQELRIVVRTLSTKFESDILVEEYIQGREISAFVFNTSKGLSVCMSEDILKGGTDPFAIASYEFRWIEENPIIETRIFKGKKIEEIMKRAYTSMRMYGYSKFDARVKNGVPYIIDVNPNPAFAPPENDSPFAKTAESLYGIPFTKLLHTIITSAIRNPSH